MWRVHSPWLRLIGPPAWHHAGGELRFAAERPYQLLALLAHGGDWVPRERLAALFWPLLQADAARRNLRKVLYRLRDIDALPRPEESAGALRWAVPTDVQRLERDLAEGRLQAVADAWPAQPFEGLDGEGAFAQWVAFQRQALRQRWRAALLQGAAAHDDPVRAADWAERLRAHDPLDEEALRLHLQALMKAGRSADARRVYQAFEAALARELAVRPQAATLTLAAALTSRGASAPAPAAELPLVGRKAELQDLHDRLARADTRWVTVLGPGGIGKTCLVQALTQLRSDAVVVPLQDLTRNDDVPARVARCMGLGASAGTWPGLLHALSGQAPCLVLDNVEQLPGLAQAVAPLLAGAPKLRVLATSRRRVGVPGEQVLELGGLPFPDAEDTSRAADFDAVQLFAQAARRHRGDFELAPQHEAVAALCRAVEGWPLALELAAAWTPRLHVAEIVHELQQGRHQLLARDPAAPPVDRRHASLHDVMQASWQALAAAEREAAARLSVLEQPAGSVVAAVVAGVPLQRLATLADGAWLRREDGRRWGLHPLLRSFLGERLAERPRWRDAAIDALCSDRSLRAEACPAAWHGRGVSAALDELDQDLPALMQAWSCSVAAGRADRLQLLLRALLPLLVRRSAWAEGLALLLPALPLMQGQAQARLQAALACLQLSAGQVPPAVDRVRQALRLLRRGTDRGSLLLALYVLGQGLMRTAQFTAARHALLQALALARELGDTQAEALVLEADSGVAYGLGRHDEQIALLRQAIALSLQQGGKPVVSLSNLGNALRATGRIDEALAAFERGAAMAQGPALRRERATVLLNLGLLLGDRGQPGDLDRALDAARQGLQAAADGVDPRIELHLLGLLAGVLTDRGDAAGARARLVQALVGARRLGLVHAQQWLLLDWARWLHRNGQAGQAFRVLGCVAAQPDLPAADRASLTRLRHEWGAAEGLPDPREAVGAAQSLAALLDEVIAQG